MSAYIKQFRDNAGFILTITNLVLFLLIIFSFDPMGFFKKGYGAASPILDLDQSQVSQLDIIDPDNRDYTLSLTRKVKLKAPSPVNQEKKSVSPRYAWELSMSSKSNAFPPRKFPADQDRIDQLFINLTDARDYYSLDRSPEKDSELEMGKDKEGRSSCMQLVFIRDGGAKKDTLCLGKARAEESYIRLNEDDEIFLASVNLKTLSGAGEVSFFRNRNILPPVLTAQNIATISAQFNAPGNKSQVIFTRNGKDWQLDAPISAPADKGAVSSLLSDILNWKAASFPESLPEKLDQSFRMTLDIIYNESMTQPRKVTYEFLGKKDYSTYFLKDAAGTLYSINSSFLGDLTEAEKRFKARRAAPGPGGIPLGQ